MLLHRSGGFEPRDPSVIYHDGAFYHCHSTRDMGIFVRRGESLEALCHAPSVCVYRPEAGREYSRELWAPELHVIDGECYIYVACDDGNNFNHRMYVLKNGSSDPQSPYTLVGKLTDPTDKWAIDGTVFRIGGQLYTVWSGWEGDIDICQNLYIAKMGDPTSICSERVMISTPEHDWEKRDCVGDGKHFPFINEGPFAYESEGELYILYSASGSWANHYCIGLIKYLGGDPLDPASWEKQDYPALSIDDGYNGPGHCSVCSDGERDYIAFHTYDEGKTSGWQNVHALIFPFRLEGGKIVRLDQ